MDSTLSPPPLPPLQTSPSQISNFKSQIPHLAAGSGLLSELQLSLRTECACKPPLPTSPSQISNLKSPPTLPSCAPTAQLHTSLGQSPQVNPNNIIPRPVGTPHTTAPSEQAAAGSGLPSEPQVTLRPKRTRPALRSHTLQTRPPPPPTAHPNVDRGNAPGQTAPPQPRALKGRPTNASGNAPGPAPLPPSQPQALHATASRHEPQAIPGLPRASWKEYLTG
jgi:hypothetical protein